MPNPRRVGNTSVNRHFTQIRKQGVEGCFTYRGILEVNFQQSAAARDQDLRTFILLKIKWAWKVPYMF